MENFKGMVRDTLPINNPEGTWHHARNVVNNKDYKAVSNEDGNSFEYLVPGVIIGIIPTNSSIVYFSKNTNNIDEIGIVNTNTTTPVYTPKIRSSLFNFQLNCPIEGVFIYNFKGELIINWINGVNPNSNKPFVLNLSNIPIELDGNLEPVNEADFTKLYQNPAIKEGDMDISYTAGTDLGAEAVYISYKYVLDSSNNDDLNIFPIGKVAYFKATFLAGERFYFPIIHLTNLDVIYNELKLIIVIKKNDGTLQSYESNPFKYVNQEFEYILDAFESFNSISNEESLINKTIFEKAETITIQENRIHIGYSTTASSLEFQKYANLLKIAPTRTLVEDSLSFNLPSLMPDEVYSFYIHLHFLNGEYSDGYHIPGDAVPLSELEEISASDISTYKLQWAADLGLKRFHVFNKGTIIGDTDINNTFGYWNNIETYPDTFDYDSTTGYDLQFLNGEDLRGKPIRYHRVPNFNECNEFEYGDIYESSSVNNKRAIIGVSLLNFHTVVPQEIKDKIQGYKISFVKRTQTNNYVLGNWFISRRYRSTISHSTYEDIFVDAANVDDLSSFSNTFTLSRIFSSEIFKNKPTLSPTFIQANFGKLYYRNYNKYLEVTDNFKFTKAVTPLTYIPGNNAQAGTQYREEGVNIQFESSFFNASSFSNFYEGILNITAFSYKTNLYVGFKSNDLVVLDRTSDLNNITYFKGGDVFIGADVTTSFAKLDSNNTQRVSSIYLGGMYSSYNNLAVYYRASDLGFADFYEYYPNPDPVLEGILYNLQDKGTSIAIINNISTNITFTFLENSISTFPYRINRSIAIGNETLSIKSLRTFLINDYYDLPNNKGEIIALRGLGKKLFIQLRYALYIATIKDKLQSNNVDAYLGQSDLFEYPPTEAFPDDKGFIGSCSKFACIIVKGIYITINQLTGQIFFIKDSIMEISKNGMRNWFKNNWDIGLEFTKTNLLNNEERIDNPYVSVGHLVGYDKEFERILFIKKHYSFIGNKDNYNFDGEFYTNKLTGLKADFYDTSLFKNLSKTFSYSLEDNTWIAEHDYTPNIIFNTHTNLYSVVTSLQDNTSKIYKHNNPTIKGEYYDKKYNSYIDFIFNKNLSITKLYKTISWVTTSINNIKGINQFKTINKVMLYNENQCSGIIHLTKDNLKPRNNEWYFNDFRDLMLKGDFPIIDEDGELIDSNLNSLKLWFEKSNFISKFIVVRLIIDNKDNDDVYIHKVNVKSVINR